MRVTAGIVMVGLDGLQVGAGLVGVRPSSE